MRFNLALGIMAALVVACGSSQPSAALPSGPTAPPAAVASPAPPIAASSPVAPMAPAVPGLSPAELSAWSSSEQKLSAAAKRVGATCGSVLEVELSKEQWAGKIVESSGPDALAGGGLPVCLAGLDAIEDLCKKDPALKRSFAGWIKQYHCWPARGPSVGTSGNAFELAFLLPGRTPADYRKLAADSLEQSLKAAK